MAGQGRSVQRPHCPVDCRLPDVGQPPLGPALAAFPAEDRHGARAARGDQVRREGAEVSEYRDPTATMVAFASPTPEVAVNGPVVHILTTTGDENYTCVYTISVTFTDGSKHDQRGQTDPPAKCQACVSASWNLAKAIA